MKLIHSLLVCALGLGSVMASAEEVNVYSARKEALIKPLLDKFTDATDIKVNLVTGKADALITRMQNEGEFSPVDLLLTTDIGRLHRAKEMGLLQTTGSDSLEQNIPENLRDSEGYWFALTMRARPIMYHPDRVKPEELNGVLDLADPKWKGRVCIRSSSNIYNQSMVAAMIYKFGEEQVQQWADAFTKNFARRPKGGDRDQIKAVVAGECDIAIANTYYLGGMLADVDSKNAEIAGQLKVFWPDQQGTGTHVNVSGGAVSKYAPNAGAAKRLLEFLASKESQKWYAEVNHEYPVREGIEVSELLKGFGDFKAEQIPLEKVGLLNGQSVKVMDKAGWR